jgi:ketosteroid isomerase-like protein
MPTFLSDPSQSLYIILVAIAVVLAAVAVRRQRRSDLFNFLIVAIPLLALVLIDVAVESPREQVEKAIKEMGTATRAKKVDDVFKHISDSFKYKSLDKKGLQDKARQAEAIGFGGISEYDLARSGFRAIDANTIEQGFRVKHNGQPEAHFYVVGTFKKDTDGQWRLSTFKVFDPVNIKDEKDIPGL